MPSDVTPFSQAMGQAKTTAEELGRMFGELKFPAMPDMDAVLAAHKRNMEVLTQANRIAIEGAQAVAKRHMEIMQQTMGELSETMRSMATADAPAAKAAQQADLLKRGYERAVANVRELSDLIARSNGEAVGLLNKRFAEAMDEVKSLLHQAKDEPPKPA